MSYEQQVATAMRATADAVVPPVDDLVRGGRRLGEARRRRRNRTSAALSAGLVALVAVGVAVGPRLGRSGSAVPLPPAVANPSPTGGCAASLLDTPLPSWANAGFSDPAAPTPHTVGVDGNIAAIPFGQLTYPEGKDHANKVLWVTKVAAAARPLDIVATLESTGQVVRRQVPNGPGPSYVELPRAGCWHLALSWNGGLMRDSLDLFYAPAG
jgi:hypothetical protein